MTNHEMWLKYMEGNHAPKQYINAGWYFAIAAALERRVWLESSIKIFPNLFVLLCGQPGVGKSIVTSPVCNLLNSLTEPGHSETKPNYTLARGPDSSSFEKIASVIAEATRTSCEYTDKSGRRRPYVHATLRLELDEFTSMFKKHAEDAVTFFCSMWTGQMNYDRSTQKHGQILLINPLVNLIAGTTPKAMQDLHKLNIIGRGLDRRLLIVYAPANEYRQLLIPPKTEEQNKLFEKIRAHIKALSEVCGPVELSPEALEVAQTWWADRDKCRLNKDPRMDDYENNKNVPTLKMAIVLHMSEGKPKDRLREPISAETMHEAIRVMRSFEVDRHLAYDFMGDNTKHMTAMMIYEWIRHVGEVSFAKILENFHYAGDKREIEDVLEYLIIVGRIVLDPATANYKLRNK